MASYDIHDQQINASSNDPADARLHSGYSWAPEIGDYDTSWWRVDFQVNSYILLTLQACCKLCKKPGGFLKLQKVG